MLGDKMYKQKKFNTIQDLIDFLNSNNVKKEDIIPVEDQDYNRGNSFILIYKEKSF
jgi:hypothetical protein